MFVFGVDVPLVEIIMILAIIVVLILVLFIYLAVKLIEMNRRMDRFSAEEKREFVMVKKLSKELMGTNKSELKELGLLKDLRTDIHGLVRGGHHTIKKVDREERKLRSENKHRHALKISKRKKELKNKHQELVDLLMRVDNFIYKSKKQNGFKKNRIVKRAKNVKIVKRSKKNKNKTNSKQSKTKKRKSKLKNSKTPNVMDLIKKSSADLLFPHRKQIRKTKR